MPTDKNLQTINAVNASMPPIKIFVQSWLDSLEAAIRATESLAAMVHAIQLEEELVIYRWENEGGLTC